MLQLTVDRLRGLVPIDRVWVVTGQEYADQVREHLPELPPGNLILEPAGRDTAPCVGLASLQVQRLDPEGLMLVLPADHLIVQVETFRGVVRAAAAVAAADKALVTLGIRPTAPETGYGYIQLGERLQTIGGHPVHRAARFAEKPDRATAAAYLAGGDYLWNSGMFVWKVSVIREEIAAHLPWLDQGLRRIEAALAAGDDTAVDREFLALDRISIDYGVMEHSRRVLVIPGDFGWDDVGGWLALERHGERDQAGNVAHGEAVLLESSRCIVDSSGRLVVALGVDDLVIVESPDAVLVCRKDRAADLKAVTTRLKQAGTAEYL